MLWHPGPSRRCGVSKQCLLRVEAQRPACATPEGKGPGRQAGARHEFVEHPSQTEQIGFHLKACGPLGGPVQMLITGHADSRIKV